MTTTSRFWTGLLGLCFLFVCAVPMAAQAPPDGWLEWADTIRLEESPEVVNVLPRVRPDPRGGFLVADAQEAQIRRYGPDGELLWATGGKGEGPLEFRAPAVALRLPSGEIFVADRHFKMLTLDSAGTSIAREFSARLTRVDGADLLNDSLVVISGLAGDPRQFGSPRLHVLNVRRDSITRRFFAPFAASDPRVAGMMGFVTVSARDGRIAAAALPMDSVYVFDSEGRVQHRFRLPTEHFRRVEMISPMDFRDESERAKWLESFDTISGLSWVGPNLIVAMTRRLEGMEPHWSMPAFTARGEPLFEWRDAPQLLGSDPLQGRLFFRAADQLAPNVLWVAQVRPGG